MKKLDASSYTNVKVVTASELEESNNRRCVQMFWGANQFDLVSEEEYLI